MSETIEQTMKKLESLLTIVNNEGIYIKSFLSFNNEFGDFNVSCWSEIYSNIDGPEDRYFKNK